MDISDPRRSSTSDKLQTALLAAQVLQTAKANAERQRHDSAMEDVQLAQAASNQNFQYKMWIQTPDGKYFANEWRPAAGEYLAALQSVNEAWQTSWIEAISAAESERPIVPPRPPSKSGLGVGLWGVIAGVLIALVGALVGALADDVKDIGNAGAVMGLFIAAVAGAVHFNRRDNERKRVRDAVREAREQRDRDIRNTLGLGESGELPTWSATMGDPYAHADRIGHLLANAASILPSPAELPEFFDFEPVQPWRSLPPQPRAILTALGAADDVPPASSNPQREGHEEDLGDALAIRQLDLAAEPRAAEQATRGAEGQEPPSAATSDDEGAGEDLAPRGPQLSGMPDGPSDTAKGGIRGFRYIVGGLVVLCAAGVIGLIFALQDPEQRGGADTGSATKVAGSTASDVSTATSASDLSTATSASDVSPTTGLPTADTLTAVSALTCKPGQFKTSEDYSDLLPNAKDIGWCGVASDGSGMLLYGVYSDHSFAEEDANALSAQYNTAAAYGAIAAGGTMLVVAYDAGMTGPNDPKTDLWVLAEYGYYAGEYD